MEKRNFYIAVASICIGMTIFWLTVYNVVELNIDPYQYIMENIEGISQEEIDNEENQEEDEEIVVTITGKVKEELKLSLSDIKSDNYINVEDKEFKIVTQVEPHYISYSGASLWSILEVEDILESDASQFRFIGEDGYKSPKPLDLSLAEDNVEEVILAYEEDGEPLFEDGPIRSVIDHDVIPEEYSSQYSVRNLVEVEIT